MTKEQLIAKLEGAKTLTSVVSIDTVVTLIRQLDDTGSGTLSVQLADEIGGRIAQVLDYNSGDFVDTDSAEFELDYNNRISLDRVDVDTTAIMEHITSVLDSFVVEEAEEEEEGILTDITE